MSSQTFFEVSQVDESAETEEWGQRLSQSFSVISSQAVRSRQLLVDIIKHF